MTNLTNIIKKEPHYQITKSLRNLRILGYLKHYFGYYNHNTIKFNILLFIYSMKNTIH